VAQQFCGVDVSKARLDAEMVDRHGEVVRADFTNEAAGIADFAALCREHGVELVVMEATGGYERLAFLLLWEAGIACAVANARSVRRFAEAMGVLEKTDRIDAGLIRRFAEVKKMQPDLPPSPGQQGLTALVRRLGQVTNDLVVQKQRRQMTTDVKALASLDELIAFLKRQSRSLEGEIAGLIDDDPLWRRLGETFRSIKGVAGRSIARLMADLPEIGTYSNRAIAKLVGLAPIAKESGTLEGKRHIRAGRAPVRSILFLVADIARRYDPGLRQFHQRLLDAKKPKMVIRIALARKLLVKLNAKARDARIAFANAT
jgi:transposase